MKLSSVLPLASILVSALAAPAGRVFKLKVANSANTKLNNFYIENLANRASFNSSGTVVEAYFADDGSRRLNVNGLDSTEDTAFLIPTTPGSLVSNFAFADVAVPEARFTKWTITNGKLDYGREDRFYAFPVANGWEVQWVDEGAVIIQIGFPIDLAVEFL